MTHEDDADVQPVPVSQPHSLLHDLAWLYRVVSLNHIDKSPASSHRRSNRPYPDPDIPLLI
jgi:hypothetical protein